MPRLFAEIPRLANPESSSARDFDPLVNISKMAGELAAWPNLPSESNGGAVIGGMLAPLVDARKQICRALAVAADEVGEQDDCEVNLIDYWLLGEELSVVDLSMIEWDFGNNVPIFSTSPEYRMVDGKPYEQLRDVLPWDESQTLTSVVDDYVFHSDQFEVAGDSSIPGGCVSLLLSLLHPQQYPSTIWVVSCLSTKALRVAYAGNCFSSPGVLLLINKTDLPLIALLGTMAADKAAGKRPEDCGWMKRALLYGGDNYDTVSKAWIALTDRVNPMGTLEFVRTNKAENSKHPHRGKRRLGAWLAEADCRICFNESKETRIQS